jgi:hypothetical protein
MDALPLHRAGRPSLGLFMLLIVLVCNNPQWCNILSSSGEFRKQSGQGSEPPGNSVRISLMPDVPDTVLQATHGRPYVLVVMAYKDEHTNADKHGKLFKIIHEVVEQEFGLACRRADQVLRSGHELLVKIHDLIEGAALIIGEISEPRPNVFYELGYAKGLRKTPLLLIEKGVEVPYDLRGIEVLEYENTIDGVDILRERLIGHLHVRLRSDLLMLRRMLAPSLPEKSYIVASPKYPGESSRLKGQVFDTRTFGDQLGILGVIAAFGSLYGDAKNVELISAQYAPKDLLQQDINLFLIGSKKVNPPAGKLLPLMTQNRSPRWEFAHADGIKKPQTDDWPVALYRIDGTSRTKLSGELIKVGDDAKAEIWRSDYGLLIRGPHPHHPKRLVMMIAGAHSLGSAAASLAATRTGIIAEIHDKLPDGVMEDKSSTFWALVKGTVSTADYLLDEAGVSVEGVGVYS